MKSLLRLAVIFSVIGLIIFGYGFHFVNMVYAQSTLSLQKQCADGAKKFFDTLKLRDAVSSYVSHYNRKLDKCFIHYQSTFYKDNQFTFDEALGDVFEEKSYAMYTVIFVKKEDSPFKEVSSLKEDAYVLESRFCTLGEKQSNSLWGMEFDDRTKSWVNPKIIEIYQDPIKKKFDDWVKPYMEE